MMLAELLQPISAHLPSGDDLEATEDLSQIAQMRGNPGQGGLGALAADDQTDWRGIARAAAGVLREKSKDLRIACWWMEARIAIDGLLGLCEGLELLTGLVSGFWQNGLHPSDDVESRVGVLEWLDGKLAASAAGAAPFAIIDVRYSWGEILASQSSMRSDQIGELARVLAQVTRDRYGDQADRAAVAVKLVSGFESLLAELSHPLIFGRTRKLLGDIRLFIASRYDFSEPVVIADSPAAGALGAPPLQDTLIAESSAADPSRDANAWNEWICQLRAGQPHGAEPWMARALQNGSSARDLFIRKLDAASVLIDHARVPLAKGILIGLMEQVEALLLEQWESPEFLARLWSLLYKACAEQEDGAIREKAYAAICRLTPWAILNLEP